MAGNSFGQSFRITTAGESHGPANVVIIDGCPPGLELSAEDLQIDLDRRRPGQSRIVTQRKEADRAEVLAGVFEGKTTGTSIAILIRNQDARSEHYDDLKDLYRPGHADFVYDAKYGFRDWRGGGRSSARETVARVAAGAVAKKLLSKALGTTIVGYVVRIGDIRAAVPPLVTLEEVEKLPGGEPNVVRCPDPVAARKMAELIEQVRKDGDSIGGVAEVVASGVPAGLGEPVFDKLKADLGHALLSIPAVLGVEYGIGFEGARLRGSENNDVLRPANWEESALTPVAAATNRHGGILGGISSGQPIVLRAAVKPTSTIPREQDTVSRRGKPSKIRARGRHDPCVLPRFVPIAEAMVAIVLADHWMRWRGQRALEP